MFTSIPHPSPPVSGRSSSAARCEADFVRYATSGVHRGGFDAACDVDVPRLVELADATPTALVARTALRCKQLGRPTIATSLVAYLAARDVVAMNRVFARIVDDGKELRSFVKIVRSGVMGRRSFGSAPKRAVVGWFQSRPPAEIFRHSPGHSPSMSDVIKMVRPSPRNDQGEPDAVREALYGYLIGKNVDVSSLPVEAQALEAYKRSGGPLPDLPVEMLTTLPLGTDEWAALAPKLGTRDLHGKLVTLARHGVFASEHATARIAQTLKSADDLPLLRLLESICIKEASVPRSVLAALEQALERALVGRLPMPGSVVVCPDVSGSMQARMLRRQRHSEHGVRCIDVAALVVTAILRSNDHAELLPFSSDVTPVGRPVTTSPIAVADRLTRMPGSSTSCATPLRWLNARGLAPDHVVIVSDDQCLVDFRERGTPGGTRLPVMNEEWRTLVRNNPRARLVLVDLKPSEAPAFEETSDVLHVSGFSDAVFDAIGRFARGELDGQNPVREVERIVVD